MMLESNSWALIVSSRIGFYLKMRANRISVRFCYNHCSLIIPDGDTAAQSRITSQRFCSHIPKALVPWGICSLVHICPQ